MDYYNILEVSRTASLDEIKQAYKKKVKQHHPDIGGDPEKFKQINEAYEILSNTDKRRLYDNPQPNFNFRSQNFNQENFDHIFEQFGFSRHSRPKNKDITLLAEIELSDVFTGKELIIQYRLKSGELETVTVNIPAGAKDGDTIRYEYLGDDFNKNFKRGDLHVKIKVKSLKGWVRDGNNIMTKKSVNALDLMLGCAILVETLDNRKVMLNVPRGTPSNKIFSITEYGLPDLRTGKKGNLYIQIQVDIPMIEDTEVLNNLTEIRNKLKKD